MESDSTLPPSLRLRHLWPINDRVEARKRLLPELLETSRTLCEAIGMSPRDITEYQTALLDDIAQADRMPSLTPEQYAQLRAMFADAVAANDVDPESVNIELDNFVEALVKVASI
jgi:hypothetical protein